MESTLSDEKDDGNSNSVWNGYMKSGIVINAIKDAKNTYQVDLINNQNTINVNKESDGFTADIYFDEYQFGLSVNVKLDGEDVVVSVPDKSIKEDADGIYISTVSLFLSWDTHILMTKKIICLFLMETEHLSILTIKREDIQRDFPRTFTEVMPDLMILK